MSRRSDYRHLFNHRFRVFVMQVLPLTLVVASLIDFLVAPAFQPFALLVRFGEFMTGLALLQTYRFSFIRKKCFTLPMHLLLLGISCVITYTGMRSGLNFYAFSFRFNVVAILSFGFMPWMFADLLVSSFCIYVPFIVYYLYEFGAHAPPDDLSLPITAALTTVFTGVITNHSSLRDVHAALVRHRRMNSEIRQKAKTIEIRTQEKVHLERLTTQFSPQVLEAIKVGKISVDTRQRRNVSVIFIDIENSSARSRQLSHDVYDKVVEDFFTIVVECLLKHNITVGTFLGDGLIAFSNAPQEEDGHEVRALRASLDILDQMKLHGARFSEVWQTPFNIRIGINTGMASVGFFPNARFGTYTALGEAVNLAARLCSGAAPNSICITDGLLELAQNELRQVKIDFLGSIASFKGFGDASLATFTLRSLRHEKSSGANLCPTCNIEVIVEVELRTSRLLVCEKCGHMDFQSKADDLTVKGVA